MVAEGNLLIEMAPDQGYVAVFPAAFLVLLHFCCLFLLFEIGLVLVPGPFVDFRLCQAEPPRQLSRLVLLKHPIPAESLPEHPVLLRGQVRVLVDSLIRRASVNTFFDRLARHRISALATFCVLEVSLVS